MSFILIVGAGRVGSAVARAMLAAGHDVSILDEDPLSHERLESAMDTTWEDAGGRSTDGDNTNLTIAQIAQRQFEVPKVIARVMDPARAEWYAQQGMQTICPTRYAIEMFELELEGV